MDLVIVKKLLNDKTNDIDLAITEVNHVANQAKTLIRNHNHHFTQIHNK